MVKQSAGASAGRIEEERLEKGGCAFVVGVDEAGRGPLAGPVVAAACWLPKGLESEIQGIRDSKKLTEEERDAAFCQLVKTPGVVWAAEEVDELFIDRFNILSATKLAMTRCIRSVAARLMEEKRKTKARRQPGKNETKVDSSIECLTLLERERRLMTQSLEGEEEEDASKVGVLVDGNQIPPLLQECGALECRAVVGGDDREMSIAAASIIAKVVRDRRMFLLHQTAEEGVEERRGLKEFEVEGHKGYPTGAHRGLLSVIPPSSIHRWSFNPVWQSLLKFQPKEEKEKEEKEEAGARQQKRSGAAEKETKIKDRPAAVEPVKKTSREFPSLLKKIRETLASLPSSFFSSSDSSDDKEEDNQTETATQAPESSGLLDKETLVSVAGDLCSTLPDSLREAWTVRLAIRLTRPSDDLGSLCCVSSIGPVKTASSSSSAANQKGTLPHSSLSLTHAASVSHFPKEGGATGKPQRAIGGKGGGEEEASLDAVFSRCVSTEVSSVPADFLPDLLETARTAILENENEEETEKAKTKRAGAKARGKAKAKAGVQGKGKGKLAVNLKASKPKSKAVLPKPKKKTQKRPPPSTLESAPSEETAETQISVSAPPSQSAPSEEASEVVQGKAANRKGEGRTLPKPKRGLKRGACHDPPAAAETEADEGKTAVAGGKRRKGGK